MVSTQGGRKRKRVWAEGSLGDIQRGRVGMRGTVPIPTNFVLSSSMLSTSFQGLSPTFLNMDALTHLYPTLSPSTSDDNLSTDVLQAPKV